MKDMISFFQGVFWLLFLLSIVIGVIGAYLMSKSAAEKGYGPEAHIMAICFWLGIYGYFYALSLPDKKLQRQNESINNELKNQRQEVISDELPDL